MRADISTTYNIRRVPGDQPHYLFYHIGTWGGRCPVKEGFMEEIVFEWFSKNRRSPRGRWRLFQAKGEVCAKVKWHDLGVSWGFLRENLLRRLRCGAVSAGSFAQGAESNTGLLQLMKSAASIFSHQPAVLETPLTSLLSPLLPLSNNGSVCF